MAGMLAGDICGTLEILRVIYQIYYVVAFSASLSLLIHNTQLAYTEANEFNSCFYVSGNDA